MPDPQPEHLTEYEVCLRIHVRAVSVQSARDTAERAADAALEDGADAVVCDRPRPVSVRKVRAAGA